MARVYVASSWRNEYQPRICKWLGEHGHQFYDFRNPPQKAGFAWKDIDQNWEQWSLEEYRSLLGGEKASHGFIADLRGMMWADTCLLVLPCGRSAHLEAGWMAGQNKRLIIYIPEKIEPDLMYLLGHHMVFNYGELEQVI